MKRLFLGHRARLALCLAFGHDTDPATEGFLRDRAGDPVATTAICRRCNDRVVTRTLT